MFAGNTKQPEAEIQNPLEAKWPVITLASGPTQNCKVSILHRAYEPQECSTRRKVESVANIAAIVSPAASFPEWED
jgi:hypothetical protein